MVGKYIIFVNTLLTDNLCPRQYRYETLVAPSAPLTPELTLMDELAVKFLKTYQVWHHRRLLVTITRKAKEELAFIRKGLQVDEKNYHTWSYRQWILAHFGGTGHTIIATTRSASEENRLENVGDNSLWEGELDFIDSMLNSDIRNNSAWHHRFFVVWACGIREGDEDRAHIVKLN
jgi:protein farnesyltransferase/geranylgeranyltransferase type-1 subunit alpha